MARIVLLVDPNTGALVDIAGRNREGGKFLKFVRRMLSLDKNPILDYGANGGDTLEISKNGAAGKTVNIKADTVNVSGDIKSKGQSMTDIAYGQIAVVLTMIRGKEGEISVSSETDAETGKTYLEISLSAALSARYVSKQALAQALEDIEIHEDDTLEDVKTQFSALIGNLRDLAEAENVEGESDE